MVREPPRTNSEEGMYGKPPTLYRGQIDGSDPVALGVTLKPTRKQWDLNPIWSERKNGRGRELCDQLPNLCVLLHVGYKVFFGMTSLDTVCDWSQKSDQRIFFAFLTTVIGYLSNWIVGSGKTQLCLQKYCS